MDGGTEGVPCPVCGNRLWRPLFDLTAGSYVACGVCGTGRLDPLPSQAEAARVFADEYFAGMAPGGYRDYDADRGLHLRNARARIRRLQRAGGRAGPVLDVGAASGHFLEAITSVGWGPAVGVDVSPWARTAAAERGVTVVESMTDPGGAAVAPFHAVTFFQSLEHMPDPLGALRQARALVADDARLLVESWDMHSRLARLLGARWQQVSPPSVLWLWDRSGLVRLLERAGFAPGEVAATGKWVSAGTALGQLASRAGHVRPRLQRLAAGPLGRVGVPYRLGDLVTAAAAAT